MSYEVGLPQFTPSNKVLGLDQIAPDMFRQVGVRYIEVCIHLKAEDPTWNWTNFELPWLVPCGHRVAIEVDKEGRARVYREKV